MSHLLIILSILSSFLVNLEQKTLQTDFTMTVSEEVNAPMNFPGKLTIHGRLFTVSMYDIDAAYDGKTLYMYSAQTDELTLTNPTEQELIEANPFLFAKAMVDACHVTEKTSSDGKQTVITLTPKDQSIGINRFVLMVRNADLMPLQLEMKEGKKMTTLKLQNPAFVTTPQEYVIKPEADTFINDMRF